MLVSGGTSSGKTTTLNALAFAVGDRERIVTIEDAAELRLPQPDVVALETRAPSVEGSGAVDVRALLRAALRMRPDRIVVGEVRGGEALDMLQAMNTGHRGSLTTAHANGAPHALMRIETMALMGGIDLPLEAIREQIRRGIDVVVHQERDPAGARRIVEIAELSPERGDPYTLTRVYPSTSDAAPRSSRRRRGSILARVRACGKAGSRSLGLSTRSPRRSRAAFRCSSRSARWRRLCRVPSRRRPSAPRRR